MDNLLKDHRLPLDKDEGFVKGHESVAVREHRFFCQLG